MTSKIQCKNRGTINIKCSFNSKLPIMQVVIIWNTSEKSLLRAILRKFISEKVLSKGVNYKNNIMSACVGMSGIMFMSTETKFFADVNQIYNAIFTSSVKIQGNYTKLTSDISKGCMIYCTGKVKNLMKHLTGNTKKIDTFKNTIDAYKNKDRNKDSKYEEPINQFTLLVNKRYKDKNTSFNDTDKYALAILLANNNIDFWFDNNDVVTNDLNLLIEVLTRLNFSLLKALKFRFSKNDTANVKFTNEMYAALYNFKASASTELDKTAAKLKCITVPPRV